MVMTAGLCIPRSSPLDAMIAAVETALAGWPREAEAAAVPTALRGEMTIAPSVDRG